MTSRIEYRFNSRKKSSFVTLTTDPITIQSLSNQIIEQETLPSLNEIYLHIENAQTHHIYSNPDELIHKNSSVIIRVLPKFLQSGPIQATQPDLPEQKEPEKIQPQVVITEDTIKQNEFFF